MVSWIFRILNIKYLLLNTTLSSLVCVIKLGGANLLSKIKVRASGHFNEKVD
ncbi:hypothetical protein TH0221_10860 [Helicobacter pylori]